VYFLEAYWRLLNMVDADITQTTLVECEWIKLPYTQVAEPLIGPTFEQAPFLPVPTPTSSGFATAVFTGNTITNLCAEIGVLGVVYSNCNAITEGCSVFFDTGATQPLPEGSFIKLPSTPTIYQVVEYGVLSEFYIC
jgi:hypothetical protein